MITDIQDIIFLKKLTFLNLKNNFIIDIRVLAELKILKNVDLSLNSISDITPLASLKLKDLRLLRNKIIDIAPIQYFLRYLKNIDIDENPIIEQEGWKIDENTIQLDLIKEYFSRRKSIQEKFKMPVKILLLGNHAAGKSTLLHYLLQNGDFNIPKSDNNSTHIIRIEKFPLPSDKQPLPDVIFYDFGGQDYYHGIYKAFLTNDAINLLLWNIESNKNQLREDSNNELTRDFTREYWLHQLMYYFEKNLSQDEDNNPIILIQTHADKFDTYRDPFKNSLQQFNIENEFFISLCPDNIRSSPLLQSSLQYLMVQIKHEISKKEKVIERPHWYGDFINYILRSTEIEATNVSEILKFYKRERQGAEKHNDILNFLKSDLDQLHKQGLILYYKNELPEVAWLNPTATTQYIHSEILQKKLFSSDGKITKNGLEKAADTNIIQLLLFQKVIFLDIKDNKYVVPNFLKLTSDKKNDYNIITFGIDKPDFVLKFQKFLPFGLVNQLVSHFGNNNEESKYFWRDQLIFTLEKEAKILVKLDFSNLEISVYFQFIVQDPQQREDIKKYIFTSIMAVYWDSYLISYPEFLKRFSKHNLDEELSLEDHSEPDNEYVAYKHFIANFNRFPDDMLLSIDNVKFINGRDFISKIELRKNVIHSYVSSLEDITIEIQGNEVNSIVRKVDYEDIIEEPIYKYQIFSNIKIKKMKKIFVSYSHANTVEMNELKKFLVGFERTKEIEKWTDLQLQAGVKVKDEILRNLAEADIVILLISQDFIASDFIYDNELQLAMQKKLKGSAEIVPVVLSESTIFDLNLDVSLEDGVEEKVLMGHYYFIPQDENNNLKPIEKWSSKAEAWMVIYRHLKRIINN